MTNLPPLRAAVIGCGRIGAGFVSTPGGAVLTHAAAYVACPDTDLVAVCDSDSGVAHDAATKFAVPRWHVNVQDLLEQTAPDVVSICTPDSTHVAVLREVLEGRSIRGVFLEKPLATNMREAEAILAAVRSRNVMVAVNYTRRWAKGVREAKCLMASGQLGDVEAVAGHYANGWMHNGTHWIDLARVLIGEVVAIRTRSERPALHGADHPRDVEMTFRGGARGSLLGHSGEGLSFFEMDIVLKRGRIRLSAGAETIEVDELRPSERYAGFVEHCRVASFPGGLGEALVSAVGDLSSRIRDGAEPACTVADGVTALRIAEAAITSAGDWVSLEVEC